MTALGDVPLTAEVPLANDIRYALVSPQLALSTTDTANDTVSVTLQDRAVNSVTLGSSVAYATFTFPMQIQGYARDFFLRLVIEASTVPTITFQESGGGSVSFDVNDTDWSNIEPGVNLIMFTETNQVS